MRWLIDGMNVVGSRPDGWWRDRVGAMRRLIDQLERFAATSGDEVAVVFDGRPFALDGGGLVEVGFAPGGRDAADHAIAAWVAEDPEPGTMIVVTSDAALARAVGESGAHLVGAGVFRERLDAG